LTDHLLCCLPREHLALQLLTVGALGFELEGFRIRSLLKVERLKQLICKWRKKPAVGFVGRADEVVQEGFAVHPTAIKILIFFDGVRITNIFHFRVALKSPERRSQT